MATQTTERRSARERLLAAADELFYEEGVHTVGIDRVIERAGVAKASLYNTFGSKDELVRAYLLARHEARRERITRKLARYDTPRERLLGMFDILGEHLAEPTFRGCAFLRASAEATPGDKVERVCGTSRDWMRSTFVELSRDVGAADPDQLGRRLQMLYDGATVAAHQDHDLTAAAEARTVAEALLDAA
jgi:AcrR family transcriptional regulator